MSHEEWVAARTAFLAKEKEFTRQRDELSRQRRELPWERVEKEYTFDGPNGKVSLSDWVDNFNKVIPHLNQRDAAMVAISRAPREKLDAFEKRMGWTFQWLSSGAAISTTTSAPRSHRKRARPPVRPGVGEAPRPVRPIAPHPRFAHLLPASRGEG